MFSRKTRQSASPKGSQNEVQNELQVDRFRYRILLPKPSKILELFQNIKEFLENFPSIFFSLEIVERNEACFSRPAMLSCFRVCQGTRFFQSTISRVSASGAILGSLSTLISLEVSRYNCFLAPSEVTWK